MHFVNRPSATGPEENRPRDARRPRGLAVALAVAATVLNAVPAVDLLRSDEYSMGMSSLLGGLAAVLAFSAAIALGLALTGRRLAWVFLPLPLLSACLVLYVAANILVRDGLS